MPDNLEKLYHALITINYNQISENREEFFSHATIDTKLRNRLNDESVHWLSCVSIINIIEKLCLINNSNFTMILSFSFKIAFISKPEKNGVFQGFLSQLPETRVLKFCPELETLVTSRPATSFGHHGGRRIFWGRSKFYIDNMYESNGYAYNMSKTFFSGWRKLFQWGEALLLVMDLVTMIRYAGITLQARLLYGYVFRKISGFLFDILKSSLIGLDNSAWKFDWCWESVLDKRCSDNRKGTQQLARADKGRLIGYIIQPLAVKIDCKSF